MYVTPTFNSYYCYMLIGSGTKHMARQHRLCRSIYVVHDDEVAVTRLALPDYYVLCAKLLDGYSMTAKR